MSFYVRAAKYNHHDWINIIICCKRKSTDDQEGDVPYTASNNDRIGSRLLKEGKSATAVNRIRKNYSDSSDKNRAVPDRTNRSLSQESTIEEVFVPDKEANNNSFLSSLSGVVSNVKSLRNKEDYVGDLVFSLYYHESVQALRVIIEQAYGLKPMDRNGKSDPYVIIRLLPDKKRKFKTSVQRCTCNPKWGEEFTFRGLDVLKLRNKRVRLTVMDYDRVSPDDPIGEYDVDLAYYNSSDPPKQTVRLNKTCRQKHIRGEIQVTLIYNPIGYVLKATIHGVRALKSTDVTGKADPYVIVRIRENKKTVTQYKTEKRLNCLEATYNESFVFPIEPSRLATYDLQIKVMDYDMLKWDDEIGRIVLGANSVKRETEHWEEMLTNPGVTITKWHDIKSKNFE